MLKILRAFAIFVLRYLAVAYCVVVHILLKESWIQKTVEISFIGTKISDSLKALKKRNYISVSCNSSQNNNYKNTWKAGDIDIQYCNTTLSHRFCNPVDIPFPAYGGLIWMNWVYSYDKFKARKLPIFIWNNFSGCINNNLRIALHAKWLKMFCKTCKTYFILLWKVMASQYPRTSTNVVPL